MTRTRWKSLSPASTWDPTGPRFTYKGKKYGFGPDMSRFKGPVNMDAAKGDMRFMGDLLKQTSTVVLEPVKFEGKEEFKVDPSVTISGDTARLAVKMIGYEKFNRLNFGDINRACEGKLVDTNFQVLKFTLIFDGAKWLVTSIVEPAADRQPAKTSTRPWTPGTSTSSRYCPSPSSRPPGRMPRMRTARSPSSSKARPWTASAATWSASRKTRSSASAVPLMAP